MPACEKCGGSGWRPVFLMVEFEGGDRYSRRVERLITAEEYQRLQKLVDGQKQRVYPSSKRCECAAPLPVA